MAISTAYSTALTGLKAHQTALDVTSNNISNASNPDYVRERAIFTTYDGINSIPGDIGIGVKIQSVMRITDTFLFNRFTQTSANVKNLTTKEQYLNEIATYFPDVEDQGLNKDIKDFFDAWQTFASNPNDGAVKVDLAYKTQKMTDDIKTLRGKLKDIQKSLNEEVKTRVDEINSIVKEIADINAKITAHEANGSSHANELRDKRDALEKRLKEIADVKIYKSGVTSQDAQGTTTVDYTENYQISIGGYVLLDNSTSNELVLQDNYQNYNIALKSNTEINDVTDAIKGGELGALLDVRGREFNSNTDPKDGVIGDMLSSLDAFAQGMIRSVNSIYSYSAQESVETDTINKPISVSPDMADKPLPLIEKYLAHPVRDGNMILQVYDNSGNPTQEVKVSIDSQKSINDIISDINTSLQNAGVTDTQAKLVNGQIKFVDSNGNESPNVLVKDDGSLLFSALNEIEYMPLSKIDDTKLPIPMDNGTFDVVVYDSNGEEKARRTITVNMDSKDPRYSTIEGIMAQINTPNIDDNQNNNPNDDVDDYYQAKFLNGKFILAPKQEDTFVGLDNDTANFGGSFGVNKFFDGTDSSNISLRQEFIDDPSKIHAYKAPNEGNNEVANEILQLQFQDITFYKGDTKITNTITGFYRTMTSSLANEAKNTTDQKEAAETLYKSVSNEYYSLSGVNIDEELINLEKFQRGYQANARVITTINNMLDALFAIKQ
ncbi:flagellar hook-associated protein FlgK [Caminibacter pacificus]|uniref:Flagellar hook-associated protein 1 n=1 Tax=Caminibacter pacificus TaxID=1424653 RepID=A0AAJ4RC76_9BACT|nr:flagellar hook-associated protein FlgK [Caminibacter pacificus]QCI28916.1 flagellar hook-associated protein FlgK [Caminibacter pacificus]ROR39507.1 flagellar hook-associated protein 1 FlgK [Caminibacter pacificus]